jgi:hypothetical protein
MSPELMAMLIGLMNFAAYSTGLPTPNELPNIEWQTRCEINETFLGRCDPSQPYVAAMFDQETQTISFSIEDIDMTTIEGKATALHELVHWVQFVAMLEGNVIIVDQMKSTNCLAAAFEPSAYRAQFEWIRENRLDPWKESGVDQFVLMQATLCRPVYEEARGDS